MYRHYQVVSRAYAIHPLLLFEVHLIVPFTARLFGSLLHGDRCVRTSYELASDVILELDQQRASC